MGHGAWGMEKQGGQGGIIKKEVIVLFLPNAQCLMPNVLFLPNAQCPMPNAQCPMPNAKI